MRKLLVVTTLLSLLLVPFSTASGSSTGSHQASAAHELIDAVNAFVVGWISGSPGNNPPAAPPAQGPGTPGATYVSPVQTVTPMTDGSIVHIVQYGETLYTIAVAYGVTINFIKDLNKLTSNDIYVKQKLIIRLAYTPTPTTPITPTQRPTSTPRPTRTPTKIRPTATESPTPGTTAVAMAGEDIQSPPSGSALPFKITDPLFIGILGLAILGGILMLAGSLLRRKS